MYNFEWHQREWSNPPVDDEGYFSSSELLQYSDSELLDLVARFEERRYDTQESRNYENKWRDYLGLDTTFNKRVFDFGCGVGIESLQFLKLGNRVTALDIVSSNLLLARRIAELHGYPLGIREVSDSYPYFTADENEIDIFYANGVIHHIPYASSVLERVFAALADDGEVRLMLYSDRGWTKYTEASLPPIDMPIETHPQFNHFVRTFDSVGCYADWYNAEKIEYRFGKLFSLKRFEYITDDDRYCVAILEKK